MKLAFLSALAKLALALAKGFIRVFSTVYTFEKNKTTLAAFVVGIATVSMI